MIRSARFVVVLLVVAGCRRASTRPTPAQRSAEEPPPASAEALDGGSTVPALEGSLGISSRLIDLAIYLPTPASKVLVKEAQDATRHRFPGIAIRAATSDPSAPPAALVFAPDI